MVRPRDSVLDSPELLELVLLQLDMRTLLCAQRVCRQWQQATMSPMVQEALYFRPSRAREGGDLNVNPLLAHYFPAWFAPRWQWKERYELESTSWTRDASARDRFLRSEASWKRMFPVQPPPRKLKVITRTQMSGSNVRRGRLNVHPTSKPYRKGELETAKDRPRLVSRWNGTDINMGLIYHLAQTFLRDRVVSYFCMLWPSEMQRQLDKQIRGMRPATTDGGNILGGSVLESIRKENEDGPETLTIVFEQLRNWFERSDTTGDWLEQQNAIFARLNLRDYCGPVLWDDDAIDWERREEGSL